MPFLGITPPQSLQSMRIATANLLPTAKAQKSIHHLAVQSLDSNLFLFHPPAEIGDHDASRCSLKGPWRIRPTVFEKVKSWSITLPECQARHPELCRLAPTQIRMNRGTRTNSRHSPGSGIVAEEVEMNAEGVAARRPALAQKVRNVGQFIGWPRYCLEEKSQSVGFRQR
jgi:hypothetical protein